MYFRNLKRQFVQSNTNRYTIIGVIMPIYKNKITVPIRKCPECYDYYYKDGAVTRYYTDGACSNNNSRLVGRSAGMGVFNIYGGEEYTFRQNLNECNFDAPVTNNTAELQAIKIALKFAKEDAHRKQIAIYSDSTYALDAICRGYAEWPGGYNSAGRNVHWPLINTIRQLMDNFEHVKFYKCKAHSRNSCYGIDRADKLAVEGRRNKNLHENFQEIFIR